MNNEEKVAGKHYDFPQVKETIELIEHVVNRENIPRKSAYMIGNALKYILRVGEKSGEDWEDDIAKAENYLHRSITGEWINKK
jgi:hypothetical protein